MKIILEGSYALTEKQAEAMIIALGYGWGYLERVGENKLANSARQGKKKIECALYLARAVETNNYR